MTTPYRTYCADHAHALASARQGATNTFSQPNFLYHFPTVPRGGRGPGDLPPGQRPVGDPGAAPALSNRIGRKQQMSGLRSDLYLSQPRPQGPDPQCPSV